MVALFVIKNNILLRNHQKSRMKFQTLKPLNNLLISPQFMGINLRLFLLVFFILIASCARKLTQNEASKDLVVYPPPPDTTRVQYLTSISGADQIIRKQSSFKEYVVGKEPTRGIIKPYGIHMTTGKLYVCDIDLKGLEIIDFARKEFNYFVPAGLGQLRIPINCFIDDKGYLYVADAGRMQIVIFDEELKYFKSLGEKENFKPSDVFVADGKIWVANLKGGVYVYDQNSLEFLFSFPEFVPGKTGNVYQPTNLWVTDSAVYVSDFGEFNVKIFSHEGEFLKSVGSYGSNIGEFIRPKGIAVDKNQNLYVVDGGFEITQIFNPDGKLLMHFGGPYKGPGDMWLPVKVTIDYDNNKYFENYVDPRFNLEYLILVSNQYGPDKINVYGFVSQKNDYANKK